MRKKTHIYLIIGLFTVVCFHIPVVGQLNTSQSNIWQEPWEGVPDYYRNWSYPDYQFPVDLEVWENERITVKSTILQILGDIPPRPKQLKVKTISREEKDGYFLEKFIIDNEVDSWIPGYLAIPSNRKGKVPVIVGLHGHGSSKENIFGFSSNKSQEVMSLLLSHGFAVMAIDSYFNGERRGQGPAGSNEMQENGSDQEMSLFKINLWFNRSLWGMQLRDEQIALDYIAGRPEIDADRIGVEGMSMGSTRSWWLAAIDDRVKAIVGVACFTRYKELIEQRQLRAHGIYYFVPGMLNYFDTEALMGLIAPRPFLVLTGDSDQGSPLSGIRVLEKKLDSVYSLYKKNDHFKSIVYKNTGHVYTDDMKSEMVKWFDIYLK